jgi:hypothetical protein
MGRQGYLMAAGHHEFGGHGHDIKGSSDRSFGLVIGGFFLLITGTNYWHHGGNWPVYLSIGVVFVLLALVRAAWLAPLNRLWTKLGLLLGKIMTPIVLGGLFFLVVTPVALVARLAGKDFLRLRRNSQASSYWITRDPPGPAPESMNDQF